MADFKRILDEDPYRTSAAPPPPRPPPPEWLFTLTFLIGLSLGGFAGAMAAGIVEGATAFGEWWSSPAAPPALDEGTAMCTETCAAIDRPYVRWTAEEPPDGWAYVRGCVCGDADQLVTVHANGTVDLFGFGRPYPCEP